MSNYVSPGDDEPDMLNRLLPKADEEQSEQWFDLTCPRCGSIEKADAIAKTCEECGLGIN